MTYLRPTLIVGTATTPGMGNATLSDVAGKVSWSTIPDGSTLHYLIQDVPASSLHEWGLGTKTTSAGNPVLQRSAGKVLGGSSGAGVLVNFIGATVLVYPAQLGEEEVVPNLGADPSVSSLGQLFYRTDLDTLRSVSSGSPAVRNLVTDTYLKHTAIGTQSGMDGTGSIFAQTPGTTLVTVDVEESCTFPGSVNEFDALIACAESNPTVDKPSGFSTALRVLSQSNPDNTKQLGFMSGANLSVDHFGTGAVGEMYGVLMQAFNDSGGNIGAAYGVFCKIFNFDVGTFTKATAGYFNLANLSTGTITTGYGCFIDSAVNHGTFTNNYGLWIADQSAVGSTASYNLYSDGATAKNYFAGRVGIGAATMNAAAKVQIDSTTQGFMPPRMTTTQRDAIASPPEGLMVWNSTTHKLDVYNGSAWQEVTAV